MAALPMFVFPSAALLAGALSGLFGIGGGLFLNPVLLQIGIAPQVRLFFLDFSWSKQTSEFENVAAKATS